MNKLEAAYAQHLALRQSAREVRCYYYEGVTLKLGKDCRYTPDFFCVMADDTIECHEVKGFWRDDAKVKIRAASERFPFFRFLAVMREGKDGWKSTEF